MHICNKCYYVLTIAMALTEISDHIHSHSCCTEKHKHQSRTWTVSTDYTTNQTQQKTKYTG